MEGDREPRRHSRDRDRRGHGHQRDRRDDRRERDRRPPQQERQQHLGPELTTERILVLPGDEIDAKGLRPGYGTYREGDRVFASVMGIVSLRAPKARVIPFSGPYVPAVGDTVLAIVRDVGPTYWLVDLRASHYAPLHHSGTPWKIEYGECGEYLRPGDAIAVKIEGIDPTSRIMVTMNDEGLGKLSGGLIETVSPTKVPRVIGKSGSMIKMIQQYTGVKMVVGQNGRIWIDGSYEGLSKARQVLHIIDVEGQRHGLTDHIKLFLEGKKEHG